MIIRIVFDPFGRVHTDIRIGAVKIILYDCRLDIISTEQQPSDTLILPK